MIHISLNLPTKHRLHLQLVKRRGNPLDKPILPKMEEVMRVKKGSKFSRYFRYIFEHKNIKKLLGGNIALLLIATSFVPTQGTLAVSETDQTVISANINVLTTQKGIQYPTEKVKITQGFKFFHPGIDLDGITGDIVRPIMAGSVQAIDYSKYAYGNAILLDHGNGITSLYAHLSKILVTNNQEVNLETTIGLLGSSGRAYGDHLHLEIRDHGVAINPLLVLP